MRTLTAALLAALSSTVALPVVAQAPSAMSSAMPSAMSSAMPAMPSAMSSAMPAMSMPAMEPTPIPLAPKPNLAPLAYFLGTWSCSTKSSRRPTPQLTTITYKTVPGGRWVEYTIVNKPTGWYPYVAHQTDFITYDRDAKRWVDVGTDDLGGYTYSTTTGWTDGTLVWKDGTFVPTAQAMSESDFTITKVSPTKYTTEYTFTTGKQKSVGVKGVCTKV